MRRSVVGAIGIAALGGWLAACSRGSTAIEAAGPERKAPVAAALDARVLVNCGEERTALVRQVLIGGETVSQVDCVAAGLTPAYAAQAERGLPQIVYDSSDARVIRTVYVPERPTVRERVVRAQPVVYRDSRRYETRRVRSWKKSAAIIGGTTAGGAGIGAIIDGKKGAAIGAGIGLAAGTVYDIATREKR